MNNKVQTSMCLSVEAKRILKELADKIGISQAAVMEISIRRMAKEEAKK